MTTAHFDLEQILNDITSRLIEDAETGKLYSVVVDIAMEATSAEACSLYLEEIDNNGEDEVSERIGLVAGAGFEKYRINKATYSKGEGLTGTIWKNGEWIKCDTREQIEDPGKGWIGKYNDIVKGDIPDWESTSLIGGPLIAGSRTIGVLKLENKNPSIGKHFTNDDFNLLKLIAGIISLAIQNRRNLEQSYSKIFSAIIDVSEMILGDQVIPVSILRQKILNKCINIFNAEASSLYLEETSDITQQASTLKMVAGEGYEKNRIGIAKYQKGEGLTGRIWRDGKSVKYDSQQAIEDKSNGWLGKYNVVVKNSQADWNCSSLMGVPLKIGERTLGVLKVENKKPSPEAHFTYDELRGLEILASFIAFSLEMLRSHSDLFYKGESARSTIHSLSNIVLSTEYYAVRVKNSCNGSPGCKLAVQDSINKMLTGIEEISHSFQRHNQISDERKEVVCFNNLLSKNINLFQAIAKDNDFEFKFDGLSTLVYVNIIEDYIDRAVRNILSNAIDALTGVDNPKILVKAWTTQKESLQKLRLIINDSGPGLDEEQVKRFQENRVIRTSKHSWQGIGLPEAQGFFKANEISFEYVDRDNVFNVLGGACFEMVFLTCKPGKVNILVIDDERVVLGCFETHFQNLSNIKIDTSLSHTAFIDLIKTHVNYTAHPTLQKYDWIFLDCDLSSDLDGNALLKIIKKNDPVFAERIILMSVHKTYLAKNIDLKVYSKFDEILEESYRDKIESNLLCGLRP